LTVSPRQTGTDGSTSKKRAFTPAFTESNTTVTGLPNQVAGFLLVPRFVRTFEETGGLGYWGALREVTNWGKDYVVNFIYFKNKFLRLIM